MRELRSISTSRSQWVLFLLSFPITIGFTAADPLPIMSMLWVAAIPQFSSKISLAHTPRAREFLRTRPLRSAWVVVGTVVPAVLLSLMLPATTLLKVGALRAGLGGSSSVLALSLQEQVRYLRDVVGATWFPAAAARGPLPPAVWAALRPLLYLNVLRLAMLTLALLFSLSGSTIAGSRRAMGARPWPHHLLAWFTMLAVVPCIAQVVHWHRTWPAPPLWVSVALAVAGAISMIRAIRA